MLRSSLVAAMMLAFSGSVGAAGLGRVTVLSTLGQPLRAEVEISASADELETMTAKIASPDAYQRANIEYAGVFSAVRMTVDKSSSGKKAILRISSNKPFSEPFVDMLVELNWAGGRLLREYTFLLDPAPVQPEGQKPVLQIEEPVVRPLAGTSTKASRRKGKEAQVVPRSAPREAGEGYTTKRGDTLSKVAAEVKPAEVSQEQMIAALYKANADAFVSGNINRLRTGRVLKVPDAEEARKLDSREAHKVVIKASSFEDYREKVGAQVATAPAKDVSAGSSSGKIEPKVEDKVPSQSAQKDKVKITSTQPSGKLGASPANDTGSKARIQSLQDELATRDKALKEANSRVSDLETNVAALKKLIELKSQELAKAQQNAADGKNKGGKEAPATSQSPSAAAVTAASTPASTTSAAEPVETAASQALSSASEPVVSVSEPSASESVPVAAASKPAAVVVSAPVAEEKPADNGTSPWLWVALGFVGLTGAYVWLKQRRRRSSGDLSQLSEISTTSPNSVFGNAVGQTIDTGGTSLLHTDFSQSGMAAIDADEGVDPVAEADVYMAYGRDAQAEEILLDALKTDPNRAAIYLKLLEIYAQRNSIKQFENVANDLHVRTSGVGDDWAKAVAMGVKVSPDHPLFRTASAPASVPAVPVSIELPAEPVAKSVPTEEEPAEAVSFGTNNVSQMRSTWTMPGDINQLTTEEKGNIPVAVETPPAADASLADSLNLDFNLDLETPEADEFPTRIEPREESAPVSPVLPDAGNGTEPGLVAEAQSMPLEFDIGFDEEAAVRTNGVVPPPPVASAVSALPSIAMSGMGDDQDDIGIESAVPDTFAEVDLEKTNFEGSLLDFDFELGEDANKPALDLSSVDLNAAKIESAEAKTPHAPASISAVADALEIGDSIDVDDEVSTKLELARAYEEMGDVEGARELLEEVLNDGSDAQKQDAQAMIQRLGA